MQQINKSKWILPVVSGVLIFIAVGTVQFIPAWICFVPLFIKLQQKEKPSFFKSGFITGLTIALIGFYWMIPGAERFTGSSPVYGILACLLSALFFACWFGLLLLLFGKLQITTNKIAAIYINAAMAGAVFCVGEWLLMYVSASFPWFDFHAGNALDANLYAIQPAAFFGVFIMSFVVVSANYLIAAYISSKDWKKLWIPAIYITAYILTGFILYSRFKTADKAEKSFSVAILSENIPPEMKWDDQTGNMLVQRLFDLNKQAVALQPDLCLWSESAVPWTYKPNDDLVNEVLKITAPAHVTHVMGINTEVNDDIVNNSAYCILPSGKVTGWYDKQYLLGMIEKPVSNVLIPFFSSAGFTVQNDEKHDAPLETPFGKAGIFICNEAAVPGAAHAMVDKGATFLFNLSNDGWFSNTYIVGLHFYNARLRAVETRKDLVVNSNNGFSGKINASGEVVLQKRSENPFVEKVSVEPNNIKTLASTQPYLFVIICGLCILAAVFLKKKYNA